MTRRMIKMGGVGWGSLGLAFFAFAVGCSKSSDEGAPSASATASATLSPASPSPVTASAAPAATAPVEDIAPEAPASFEGGTKQTIENAVGLGCEARSTRGWLELLCRNKNGMGGRPVKAILPIAKPAAEPAEGAGTNDENAPQGEEVLADATSGELRLTLPYRAGAAQEVTVEWTNVTYVLKIKDASAKLDWASSTLELRKACAQLQEESKARLTDAQKPDAAGRVLPGEAGKLTRFGVCQPAGRGSWAISLGRISGKGEGAERRIEAALDLVRVSERGARSSHALGSFVFPPGGFEIGRVQGYDFDDDGREEAIFSYELKAGPASVEPALPASVWTFDERDVVRPYEKAPKPAVGGSFVEQLDNDMRPDVGDYGPFFAWLGPDCGAKKCPPRLTGPRFFAHSFPDGTFKSDDGAARGALKRSCSKKPDSVIALGEGGANAARTATNVACARVWGTPSETIVSELEGKRASFCGERQSCPLLDTLSSWARLEAPVSLAGSEK